MTSRFQSKYLFARRMPVRLFLVAVTLFCLTPILSDAQAVDIQSKGLFELSLDELLNLEVNVVTRAKEHSFEVPSALYVITTEDIRRSGMQSIPELLRMVPGLHVGRLDGNKWAISSRGPNKRFSHDLLVLMDGRTLFSPLTNGVYWDTVDTMIEDIERIEIIRGPGSSLWGTNAANGIVNIVTKNAGNTQGGLLTVGMSEGEKGNLLSLRYGFGLNSIDTKVYGKVKNIDRYRHPKVSEQSHDTDLYIFQPKSTADDDGDFMQAGFRSDWEHNDRDEYTLQGDIYDGDEDEIRTLSGGPSQNQIDVSGHNLLFRWEHDFTDYSSLNLQVYYDHMQREDNVFSDIRDTFDFDLQHNFSKSGHNLTWGAGYRFIHNDTEHIGDVFTFALDPADKDDDIFSAFFHDQYHIIEDRLIFSFGSKFEYNDYTESEFQPSAKLLLNNDDVHVLWGSISRAVSVPSRTGVDAYLDLNGLAGICGAVGGTIDARLGCINRIGEKNMKSSAIISSELGYRWRVLDNLFLDTALFYDEYDRNSESNQVEYIYGLEANIKSTITDEWKLEFSYTFHDGENVNLVGPGVNAIPKHTIIARSLYNLGPNLEIDIFFTYVDETSHEDGTHIDPDYSRLDLRLGYKFNKALYLSVLGSNLLDKYHTEANADSLKANTTVERAVLATISYRF